MTTTITEPGLYKMSNEEYHSQPALSASGMKTLLEAPAKFKHERSNPVFKDSFDDGSVWHKLVLHDAGEELVVVQKKTRSGDLVDAGDYDTVSAKEHRDTIRAEGKIPILAKSLALVTAMAQVFNAHPKVREYLDLSRGAIEQSAFWTDKRTGIDLRVRFDYLPDGTASGPFTIVDPKTAASSKPADWLRKVPDYGYHLQDAMYRRAVRELGIHPRPEFLFLVQEKTAPYIVTPIRLAPHTRAVGDHLIDVALTTYATCLETGRWPGYSDDVVHDDAPMYYLNQFEGLI